MAKETRKPAATNTDNFDAPLRVRKRDYSYQTDGRATSGVPDGDKTIKPGSPVETVRPPFKSGRLVFRPLPSFLDEDKKQLEPSRISLEAGALSDWTRTYQVARFVGHDTKYTFIVYRPSRGYDRSTNPYNVLQRAISQAVYSGDASIDNAWNLMIFGKEKKLPKPGAVTFMQGLVFENDKKVFLGEGRSPKGTGKNDLTPVIQLTASATTKFQELANEVKKGYRGDPNDFENAMVHGDLVSPKTGRFISVFNPDAATSLAIPQDDGSEKEISWEGGGNNSQQGGQAVKGFDLEILEKYRPPKGGGVVSPSLADKMDLIRKRVLFWDDILHFPCHDELCMLLATAFKSFPKMLQFGWSDHREFFTQEVKGILNSRVQSQGATIEPEEEPAEQLQGEAYTWGSDIDEEEEAPAETIAGTDTETEATDYDNLGEETTVSTEAEYTQDDMDYEDEAPAPSSKSAKSRR